MSLSHLLALTSLTSYGRLILSMREHLLKQHNFSEDDLERILAHFTKKKFKRKELLVRKGDVTRNVYFINRGCMRSYLTDYHSKEHTILFGTEGYWMGDLHGFVNKSAALYNYQAIEDTEVMAINKASWDKLMSEEPSFVSYVSTLFRNALMVQQERIVEFFTLSAEERYENLLMHRSDILNRVPQKYIASYIGITPEFFSQIRRKQSMR